MRQVGAGEPLGERHQVGAAVFAVALPREPFAAATERAHDLVRDQIDVACARRSPERRPESVRGHYAVGSGVGLHQHGRDLLRSVCIDDGSDAFGSRSATGVLALGLKRAPVSVGRRNMHHPMRRRIDLVSGAGVARQRHRPVTCAVIGALARDHPAVGFTARLAREFHRMLIGVGATQREVDTPALETGLLQQQLREPRARLGPPGVGDEAQSGSLRTHGLDDPRVLVPEVAALSQAAHVENRAPIGRQQPRAGAADDSRRIPIALAAPGMQDRLRFGRHQTRKVGCARGCRQRGGPWTAAVVSCGPRTASPKQGVTEPSVQHRWGVSSVGRASDF